MVNRDQGWSEATVEKQYYQLLFYNAQPSSAAVLKVAERTWLCKDSDIVKIWLTWYFRIIVASYTQYILEVSCPTLLNFN